MPNKRTGMDYIDYSSSKPKAKKGPAKPKQGPVKKGPVKKKKKPRYNPFSDGRTPTSASQTTGP